MESTIKTISIHRKTKEVISEIIEPIQEVNDPWEKFIEIMGEEFIGNKESDLKLI